MAERNPDREEPHEGLDGAEPAAEARDEEAALDEEAAWAQIVAAYDEDSVEPPHERAADREDDASGTDGAGGASDAAGGDGGDETGGADTPTDPGAPAAGAGAPGNGRSYLVFSAGTGPRDWQAAEPSDDDLGETDEGHFEPPEPPPLPKADTTTKFAWIAVLGGPALLFGMLIFQQPMTWWSSVLGIGGFLGGFATLVARMRPGGDDDDEPPGGGAVV